jgi:hypothetical protein
MRFKNHNFTQEQLEACRHLNEQNSQLAAGLEQAKIDFAEAIEDSAELAEMREKYPRVGSAEIAEIMYEYVLPKDYEREIKQLNNARSAGRVAPGNVINLDAQQPKPKKKGWF